MTKNIVRKPAQTTIFRRWTAGVRSLFMAGALLSATALPGQNQWVNHPNPMHMPTVGSHGLRILSPNLLELTLINTKDPNPARVTQWDFVNATFQLNLPATSQFAVLVNGQTVPVQAVGFKRRPLYAPLAHRDLRIANRLYLRLNGNIAEGATVEVRNPSGQLWSGEVEFQSEADPLRFNPAIHVNHEGYMPDHAKRAMVGYYLGSMGEMSIPANLGFRIVNAGTGAVVHQGDLTTRRDMGYSFTPTPYQQVLEADFSSFNTPGEYRLQVPTLGASYPFRIDEGIAALFARTYALGLYHQRCGDSNEFPFTRHIHGACHTAAAEVPDMSFMAVNNTLAGVSADFNRNPRHTAPQLKDVNSSLYPFVNKGPIDVSRGHHDAGDYSKYTINVAHLVHSLVFAADAFPGVGELDNLGLPESGDGKSDVLQIARWEADFLAKLQDADGGFYFLVYPRNRRYEHDVLPDKGDAQVVFPKNTAATAAAVAALAQTASSPRFKQQFPQDAARYLESARRGWEFLERAWARHGRDGSYQKITHYGNEFMHDDEIAWAAVEMYLATGEQKFHTEAMRFDPASPNVRRWGWWRLFESYGNAIRSYAFAARTGRVPSNQLNAGFLAKCEAEVVAVGQDQLRWSNMHAYRSSFPEHNKPHRSAGWYFSLEQAFDLAAAYQVSQQQSFVDAIVANMDYEAGNNPINQGFLTGIGWTRQRDIVHQYSQNDHRTLPPSGIPQGNIQNTFQWTHHYQGELTALTFPHDHATTAPHAPYERWADAFDTTAEFVVPQQARALGAVAFLMARNSSLRSQEWKSAIAEITGLPGTVPAHEPVTATLSVAGLDLSKARYVWEARDQEPTPGAAFNFAAVNTGPQWVEVEAHLPDGRRFFARTNFTATTAVNTPPNGFQNEPRPVQPDMVALYRFDGDWSDAAGRQGNLSPSGNAALDESNLGWMTSRTGGAFRAEDLNDRAIVTIPNSVLLTPNTEAIVLEAMIYVNNYRGFNRDSARILSLVRGWNASLEFMEDKYNGPGFRGGTGLDFRGSALAAAMPRNQWHHLHISIDRTGYTVRVNGNVLTTRASSDLNNWNTSGSSTLTIGNFDGWIDEVTIRSVGSSGSHNQPPTVNLTAPANGATFTAPADITLTATASDADGSVARVEFFQGATKIGERTSAPYTITWNGVPAGSYILTARATDNQGAAATSSAVSITVGNPASTDPTIAATPTLTPNGGTFTNSVSVRLQTPTPDATIRFTTDGSEPTASSPLYNEPFVLTSSVTVRARAFKSGLENSAVASATFTASNGGGDNAPGGTTAVFVKTDDTTKGSWQGVYGSDGFNIVRHAASYPDGVQVSVHGASEWVWTSSSTDARALQKTGTATDRHAACWTSGTSMSINVNVTDNQPRRIALYALDWDNHGRAQTIEVRDAATDAVLDSQSVSSFRDGRYLVWDITGHVQFRVTRTDGMNAVLSALFIDPADKPELPRRGMNGKMNGKKFLLTLTGDKGETFIIQGSTNLTDWTSISTNTLEGTTLELEDSTTNSGSRFYRAIPAP